PPRLEQDHEGGRVVVETVDVRMPQVEAALGEIHPARSARRGIPQEDVPARRRLGVLAPRGPGTMAEGMARAERSGALDRVVEELVDRLLQAPREHSGIRLGSLQGERGHEIDRFEARLDEVSSRLTRKDLPEHPLEDVPGNLAERERAVLHRG